MLPVCRNTVTPILTLIALLVQPAWAAGVEIESCLDCHQDVKRQSINTTYDALIGASVHAHMGCIRCHTSIALDELDLNAANPHVVPAEPVNCSACHQDVLDTYRQHGMREIDAHADMPACQDCHGAHDIRRSSDAKAMTHRSNLSAVCIACHTDEDVARRHPNVSSGHVSLYMSSVHALARADGKAQAATCLDCHGSRAEDGHRSAHIILHSGHVDSATHFLRVSDTCGDCHRSEADDYWQGIHGQLVKRGDVSSATCTHCHGEHRIAPPDDADSTVSANHLSIHACVRCHSSPILAERAGYDSAEPKSYIDPFHGLKSKSGRVHVANCVSCHGVHKLLPQTDPDSMVHPDNVQATCTECHPGMSESRASRSIHNPPVQPDTRWTHFFTVFYMAMIAVTIGLMLMHNVGHWVRHVQLMGNLKHVVRMTVNETLQHWILMLSFIALVITGFALRFSDAFWVEWLFGWGDGAGFLYRGPIHRISGVVFLVWCVWHLVYLFSTRGRRFIRDMIWSRKDFTHVKQSALFFLGRRDQPARFGRFSYMEKCEYWALIWGAVIMVGTGIPLWFPDYFIERWSFSLGVLNVLQVIHYYEAWLATLAIFVWHIYGVIFSPSVYPMNPAWISGKMPEEMYKREHPDCPTIRTGDEH